MWYMELKKTLSMCQKVTVTSVFLGISGFRPPPVPDGRASVLQHPETDPSEHPASLLRSRSPRSFTVPVQAS